MPRIYNSLSDAIDLCKKCFPKTEAAARRIYDNDSEEPDNRGNCFSYDETHPDYAEDEYTCDNCHKELTRNDN